ncbi:MAG: hypothetical protein Q9165_002138 [Trypethelium subeluteriae]
MAEHSRKCRYLFGQACGGIGFPPYSESFGRKKLYLASTLIFSTSSVVIAAVPSIAAVFVGRFVTGFASAIPGVVCCGTIEDLWDAKARVWTITIWLTIANIGLVLGPIYSSYATSSIGWRWTFYITAAVAGAAFLCILAIRESRADLLLQRKVKALREAYPGSSFPVLTENHVPDLRTFVRVALLRPLQLLLTEPIVTMISLMSAIAFALIYLFTSVLPIVYGSFGFSNQQTSLAFIPIGIGFLCCILTRVYDHRLIARHEARGIPLLPESKLTGFAIAAPALAIGLWWFAWTVPPAVLSAPWIVSMLSLVPVGFAINEFDCVLVGYLSDAYANYSSSAYAALCLLRSLFSAVFPLFSEQMYDSLGVNYASTILAAIASVACVSPYVLIRWGHRIRSASKFANAGQNDRSGETVSLSLVVLPGHADENDALQREVVALQAKD